MKQVFLNVFFLVCFLSVKSQHDSVKNEVNFQNTDLLNFKVDFTNLINPQDPSLLVSVEYFLTKNFSANHEAGYIVSVNSSDRGEILDAFTGFKTRHELRWFVANENNRNVRPYASVNFQYRYLAIEDRFTLGYECDGSGNCEYLKNFIGEVKTDRYVVQVRFGLQSHLSERLIFEFDAGLGYQEYKLRRSSIKGGRFVESNRLISEDSFGTYPYLSVSGKLGFVLFKKGN